MVALRFGDNIQRGCLAATYPVYDGFSVSFYRPSDQYTPLGCHRVRAVSIFWTKTFRHIASTLSSSSAVIFHRNECQEIALGGRPSSTTNMGRGKKGKKKTKVKGDNPNALPVMASRKGRARAPPYDVYGGNRGGQSSKPSAFNPSTINDRAAGDDDLTMVDLLPPKDNDSDENTIVGDNESEYIGVDIFLPAPKRIRRDHVQLPRNISTMSKPQRSLSDLYEEHPDMRLSNMEEKTLELAGQSVKQVVFEATHEFLRKCIAEADRERVWAQVLAHACETNDHDHQIVSIRVPEGTLDLKDGKRPLDLLMENCIHVLSSVLSTTDKTALKLVFNRAIVLCDALDDLKRRDALARALHALDWLILGLEVKTTAIYRSINQKLNKIWTRYPASSDNKDDIELFKERGQAELKTLKSYKLRYDGFKEPFRVGFLQTLQDLVSLKE